MEQKQIDQSETKLNTKVDTKKRKTSFSFKRLGILCVAGVSCVWMTACHFQQDMLFPRHVTPQSLGLAPDGGEIWYRDIEDGKVNAFWFDALKDGEAVGQKHAIIFFHGNAEIADHQHRIWQFYLSLGYSVLGVEYRGYGMSNGEPTQSGLIEDAVYFHQRLMDAGYAPENIVIHGRSIGGAVAAQLAGDAAKRDKPPKALVLESTFSSVVAMAHRRLLPGFLVMFPFRTDHVVRDTVFPILHLHGESDTLIPTSEADKLKRVAEKAGRPYTLVKMPGGHNDFPRPNDTERFWQTISDFLAQN